MVNTTQGGYGGGYGKSSGRPVRHRSQPGVLGERWTFLILREASQAKLPGRPGTGQVVKDSGEWLVLLPGRLPAYITEQAY